MCSITLLLSIFGVILLSQAYGQQADTLALEARLRKEAPQAWKRLESKHRETHFDWKETATDNSRDEQEVHSTSGSNCYRGDLFLIRLKENGIAGTKVWGGNDRYLFKVTTKSDDQPWSLGHFGSRGDDAHNGDLTRGGQTRLPWCIFDVPCDVLLADPSFKIQSLEKKPDGSVDLRFSVSPNELDRNLHITSGRVLFLPDRDWAISEYEANLTRPTLPKDPPVIVSASVVYGPEDERFLNIKHTRYELLWKSRGKQRGDRWERDVKCQHCDEPVESFSLASFRVPEPALPSETSVRSRPWLWLNVVAIVCLLVAIILRSRQKAYEE